MDFKIAIKQDGIIQITLCDDDLETLYYALNKYNDYLAQEKPDFYWEHHLQQSQGLERDIQKVLNKFIEI